MITSFKNYFSDFIPRIEWGASPSPKMTQIVQTVEGISQLPGAYLHELGHAITAKLLYSGTETDIRLSICGGGATELVKGFPSKIGNCLNERTREILIQGAGPFMSLIYATSLSTLGFYSGNPNICATLNGLAISHLGNLFIYAVKGASGNLFTQNGQTNDFARLKRLGIHPIFPLMGISLVIVKVFKESFDCGLNHSI
ncbi:hypothetical protein [Candidatus Protochlamydia phocaeensis]|uniref:hypothetical protein n=1 Tax=Candidatus Protochlamydia phocaeensis TaxID=1414722 RepID=UPI000837ADFD|nr:hypothetical protein [Candidatus Protochlamydia phocaeensis]